MTAPLPIAGSTALRPAAQPATVTVLVAGQHVAVPASRVAAVDLAVPAAPVAFAPRGYEGVVFTHGVAAAQIDLGARNNGRPGAGRWSLQLDHAAGPLSLRVDEVKTGERDLEERDLEEWDLEEWDRAEPTDGASLSIDPDDLLGGLATTGPRQAATAPGDADRATEELDVLLVAGGGHRVAIPATLVDGVGRPDGFLTAHGIAHRQMVMLDGDLLPAHSLARWLGDGTPGSDSWALRLRTPDGTIALTVAELFGLHSLPRRDLVAVDADGETSLWWRDGAGNRPIQVVHPGASGFLPIERPAAREAVRTAVQPLSAPSAGHSHVAMAAGPVVLVAPAAMVREVREMPCPDDLQRSRRPGSIPVFDIDTAFGGTSGPAGCVVLKRDGQRPIALLTGRIEAADGGFGWHAPPPLPHAMAALAGAVRPSMTGKPVLDCLVRPDAFRRPWRADPGNVVRTAMRASFAGWLSNW
ncbi:chemotaxis protein CheW [Azospirillum sp. B506]|uniref:chemotaxis protein CheW n=1 Tax=Azospirillum sp. B506 TaxID=137721 RepID=UPI000344E143|nr:chemotaxis protein CheW [Azospirillum sp. B506]